MREVDALVAQFLRFVARRLAADRTRRRFVVVDLARFFGEASADVLRVAHDFAELQHHFRREPRCDVMARRLFRIDGFRRPCAFASGRLRYVHLRRRDALDADVIADRTRDEQRVLLPVEFLGRGEPPFEAMAVHAGEVKNDHESKTDGRFAALTSILAEAG